MTDVLRWGRTAYETDAALALERSAAHQLGLSWSLHEPWAPTPDLRGVRALVVPSKVRINQSVLHRFKGELVLTTTSGTDHIDVEACLERGIAVARCPLARRDPVVEYALASAMWLLRRVPALTEYAKRGEWARSHLAELCPRGLSGATVLLVGLGVIGQTLAAHLLRLGATVLGVDPRGVPEGVRCVELAEGLSQADVLSIHCALTPSSRGLLDDRALALLPAHAVVINTARGPVLDVESAVERVRSGQLRGLACDVFPVEPWSGLQAASAVPGVVLSPHSAGYVHDLGIRVAREVHATLSAWTQGKPLPGALGQDVGDGL